MSARRVLVIGAGKRVRETALPAFARAGAAFELGGIFARSAKRIDAAGRSHAVRPLAELAAAELAAADLVFVAVSKPAVPEVLAALARHDLARADLLIDTPVLVPRHLRHFALLRRFRQAWVAEDCAYLPWLDAVRAAVAGGAIGELRGAHFQQSAYAYHALATLKEVLGCERIVRARRARLDHAHTERRLRFANGARARVVDPRDYAVGRFTLLGQKGSISDFPRSAPNDLLLVPVLERGECRGFRAGDFSARLDDDEAALMAGGDPRSSVTARHEAMKRVGFLRLLREISAGRGAYPLERALDDVVVDHCLERLGLWVATPFTSVRSPLGRNLLGLASRLARQA